MIDVAEVLKAVPKSQKFHSVADLADLVARLQTRSGKFQVEIAGESPRGMPIHHVRFGAGSKKALFVGFPHPNEPIGGLTVHALLSLLDQGHRELVEADIEWHVVPCIDPDGAMLNEGWSQKPFTIDSYMRNSHRPELRHQVDATFPLEYKQLRFDEPSAEAKILRELLTRIRPDFYYSLHNTASAGGVWFALTNPLAAALYRQLHELVELYELQLRRTTDLGGWSREFALGIFENYATQKVYDFLEPTSPHPEALIQHGECSWEYLHRIHPTTTTLVTELPYLKHPCDGSTTPTQDNFRRLRLRLDADNKYVSTAILEEWGKVEHDLDAASAFYKKTFSGLISCADQLQEGLPSWSYKTRDVLFNPAYSRAMTEGERFNAYLEKLARLSQSYEFVRLLKISEQTTVVKQAIERMEAVFDTELADVKANIDLNAFEPIDLTTLARVQLGSGLVVLNSILA